MYTTSKIAKALPDSKDGSPRFVVYDGVHINVIDYTTCIAFKSLSDNFSKQQVTLIYINLKPSVADSLKGAAPVDFHHCKSDKELDALISASMSQWKGAPDSLGNGSTSGHHPGAWGDPDSHPEPPSTES